MELDSSRWVDCPGCKVKRYRSKHHKTDYCSPCWSVWKRLKRRADIENIGKCLDCGTKIAFASFRCHPCDGVHARMDDKQALNRRISNSTRARIVKVLRRNLLGKKATTSVYLGCSVEELKSWLESQFKPGMSWDNYGFRVWHIDHIRPCASFDLSDIEQQKQCFHYTNLQPLWARENIQKKDKLVWKAES